MIRALLLFICFNALQAFATEPKWQPYKQNDNVQVQYRQVDKALVEIKAELRTQSMLGAFMHLLDDTSAISEWVDSAKRAEVMAKPGPQSHIVHSYFSGFWPVAPRDMVTLSVWSQDEKTGVLVIDITDQGASYPEKSGYVRMQRVSGRWQLTPLADGWLLIQYQGVADPAGKLPYVIAKNAALKATWNTFKNLQQVLVKYQMLYPGIIQ